MRSCSDSHVELERRRHFAQKSYTYAESNESRHGAVRHGRREVYVHTMFSSRGYVGNDDVILLDDAKFLERVRVFGVDDGAQQFEDVRR